MSEPEFLLKLDVNLLKTELGIMAPGKCMHIANAVTDLRPPPLSSTPTTYFPMPISPTYSQGHSRYQSQAYSHPRGCSVAFLHPHQDRDRWA
ncbi:hypothetical protein DXG01_011198 [Tephrocybe rancida]|nr:hypothetical protein DXG01_011198 [Tephrocybe rancida]